MKLAKSIMSVFYLYHGRVVSRRTDIIYHSYSRHGFFPYTTHSS